MLKLFYSPGACSLATHYFLEKMGLPYKAEAVDLKNKTDEFIKINPEGAVPVLINGDFILSQNIAIIDYLNDLYPDQNIFGAKNIQGKAVARKWLAFLNSDLHPKYYPLFSPTRFVKSELAIKEIKYKSKLDLVNLYAKIERHLANNEWLGDELSIVDIYLFSTLRWAKSMSLLDFDHLPYIDKFFKKLINDDILLKVMSDEGIK